MSDKKPPTFKNVSSSGALELPLIGRVVEAGEVFEVTPAQAVALYAQPDTWALVDGLASFKGLLDELDDAPEAVIETETEGVDE